MSDFLSTKKKILNIMMDSPLSFDVKHAELTLKWVLKIKPNADEALQLAALAHDIDRPINRITEGTHLEDYSQIDNFKREHAIRSAKYLEKFLEEEGYDKELISKVSHLVVNHEVGGDEETNVLMDADSISYFDYNIDLYFEKNGPDKTAKKVSFMYDRASHRARRIIKDISYSNPQIRKIVLGKIN